MLRWAGVILFCSCNYRLYIFNRHLRRFPRHLKILPSAGLILNAQIILVMSQLYFGLRGKGETKTGSQGVKRKTVDTKAETYSLPVSPTNARIYSSVVTCFSLAREPVFRLFSRQPKFFSLPFFSKKRKKKSLYFRDDTFFTKNNF